MVILFRCDTVNDGGNNMDKYSYIKGLFESCSDRDKAEAMSAYMKNKFVFYGIATPERREIYKGFLRTEKTAKLPDWVFLDKCYEDEHREFQYLVYDYLLCMKKYLSFEDTEHVRFYIVTKPWWDTTDFLCKVIGDIGLRCPGVSELMLEWSQSDDIWLRRTAILHQLGRKDKTDIGMLERIICNCLGSGEFFINKAIGWALREYSKTDPEWVRGFIGRFEDRMDILSIREAGKYI